MTKSMKKAIALCLFSMGVVGLMAQSNEFKIDVQKTGAPIQSTMYGIFFEDINYGADGGLYAELVKNRSFEFENPFGGWTPFGNVSVQTQKPCFDRNPHYVRLSYEKELTGTGLDNEGFNGIGIREGEKYDFSLYARTRSGDAPVKLRINLVDSRNDLYEQKEIEVSGKEWKKYTVVLTPGATEARSRLRITMVTKGIVDLEHISLFPQKTFNNRPNGMRADLAQALKELKPGVFRFPGGCIVEGTNKATRYQWKNTVGPVENRPININRWNYTFSHKKFPDYYQSCGLGFFEYFLLSEDIGAEPLPVLNCGLSCQYENQDPNENCPVDKLQPYIDDALDLIEFANGSATSEWGKIRADMGHPAPFNLKLIAIGNEQWGPLYPERLELFVKAIRAKYPEIKIIGSSGPQSEGEDFDYLWPEMRRLKVDLVDEHFYRSPEWFLNGAKRYDSYDRQGPKVFAGEYACHDHGNRMKWNHAGASIYEAAFMTTLERNADIVHMATYAPLFAHVEGWQWRPDLIWFDNLRSVKSVSYYVQQMYAKNMGTNVVPATLATPTPKGEDGLFTSAVFDKNTGEYIVKVINTTDKAQTVDIKFDGLKKIEGNAATVTLDCSDYTLDNTLDHPNAIIPQDGWAAIEGNVIKTTVQGKNFVIFKVKK